jgi:hypothetical protein
MEHSKGIRESGQGQEQVMCAIGSSDRIVKRDTQRNDRTKKGIREQPLDNYIIVKIKNRHVLWPCN